MLKNTLKIRRNIPTYQRIEDDLRRDIGAGRWTEGARLPSRRMLAEHYNVSVPTVERAVANLLIDGTLYADGARGTFAAVRPSDQASLVQTHDAPKRRHSDRLGPHITVGVIAELQSRSDSQKWTTRIMETVTSAVERRISSAGATTRVFSTIRLDHSRASLEEAVETLLAEGVDAIVNVLGTGDITRIIAMAEAKQFPLIIIAEGRSTHPVFSVYWDNYDAGYQAAQHLLARGCASLLFFSPYTCAWVEERLRGTRQAVQAAGLSPDVLHISMAPAAIKDVMEGENGHITAGYNAARALLADGLSTQGVIAANDFLALAFRRAASEAGLTAGQDYALVGFDDLPEARAAGLTSLHPPLEELGQEAGHLVQRALSGDHAPIQICLTSNLITRSSSRLPQSRTKFSGQARTLPIPVGALG